MHSSRVARRGQPLSSPPRLCAAFVDTPSVQTLTASMVEVDEGASMGASVSASVGDGVGDGVGGREGDRVGVAVVGDEVGGREGDRVGVATVGDGVVGRLYPGRLHSQTVSSFVLSHPYLSDRSHPSLPFSSQPSTQAMPERSHRKRQVYPPSLVSSNALRGEGVTEATTRNPTAR